MAMGRVTYVHHYYPALWTTRKLNKQVSWAIYGTLYIVIIGLYWLFRAISFGMVGDNKQWSHLKWLDSWRITD
jgi:dolichyl-phosphate-mannose-protein mannosyltransferase